jgi:hypothetical protein
MSEAISAAVHEIPGCRFAHPGYDKHESAISRRDTPELLH